MINFKTLTIIICISILNFAALSSESDNVATTSSDFETSNFEDEIYDPLEPFNRAIFKFNNVAFNFSHCLFFLFCKLLSAH